jgi:hypothetical protein
MTRWQMGFWSTQAAAWHWGSDSSVVNDPLGEPARTPLYVGLLSAWGSLDGNYTSSLCCVRGLPFGDSNRYNLMNKPLALEKENLSP